MGANTCGYQRTGRHRSTGIASLGVALFSMILLTCRWPLGPERWELLYLVGAAAGMAGVISSTFVSLSAITPQEHSPAVVTIYYLAQQIGMIVGVTAAAIISRNCLRDGLLQTLGTGKESIQVNLGSR